MSTESDARAGGVNHPGGLAPPHLSLEKPDVGRNHLLGPEERPLPDFESQCLGGAGPHGLFDLLAKRLGRVLDEHL